MQEEKQIPERWFSTKEMCAYLGVSRDTLLTWINEKDMPAHKVGRGWKYKPAKSTSGSRAEKQRNKRVWSNKKYTSNILMKCAGI